jgi:hypothetical protein
MRSLKAGHFGVGKRGVVAVREPWLLRQQGSRWTIYTFCLCYCGLSCGIFLTDGFRPNNRLPKAPPRPRGHSRRGWAAGGSAPSAKPADNPKRENDPDGSAMGPQSDFA